MRADREGASSACWVPPSRKASVAPPTDLVNPLLQELPSPKGSPQSTSRDLNPAQMRGCPALGEDRRNRISADTEAAAGPQLPSLSWDQRVPAHSCPQSPGFLLGRRQASHHVASWAECPDCASAGEAGAVAGSQTGSRSAGTQSALTWGAGGARGGRCTRVLQQEFLEKCNY